MTDPIENPSAARDHHLAWNDRLQDWLDGDQSPADAAALQAHMADCAMCRARAAELQELDSKLRSAAPLLALDASFDAKLFAQIEAIDDSQRAEARSRMEQELQQNLQALARGWRRGLLFVISGVIAGVALALGLAWWLADADLMRTLIVQSAGELGANSSDMVRVIVMTLLGAGVGGIVARWLASVAEPS